MELGELKGFDVQRVWEGAVEILGKIGFKIENPKIIRRLEVQLPVKNGWVRFPRELLEVYAQEIRDRAGDVPALPGDKIVIFNSPFNNRYIDPETNQDKPYDCKAIAEHTKLACQLTQEGLMAGRVTGYPCDVPPRMQLLMLTYVDCIYNTAPRAHCTLNEPAQLKYVCEIAELFGLKRGLDTELISPLKFIGGSIDTAFEYIDQDISVSIGPMPILGVTAPMDWHMGFAQTVAENLGSYIIFRLAGFEKVGLPPFRLFVPNMQTAMIYFSSPKHIMALLARRKVCEFFGLSAQFAELLLVTAKRPGCQAAAEKMAGCLLGKMFGFKRLAGAGGLWLDVIFSPVQLMIDVEICNYVNSIEADFAYQQLDLIEVMEAGLAAGGFLDADMTLSNFNRFIWRPKLFDLSPRASWTGTAMCQKARGLAEAKTAEYDYELTGQKREQLERIMARARAELS